MIHRVEFKAKFTPAAPLADSDIGDLIEAVIDDLDTAVIDPSVDTFREDDGSVLFTVEMHFDEPDVYHARARAGVAFRDAFMRAGLVAVPEDAPVPLVTA